MSEPASTQPAPQPASDPVPSTSVTAAEPSGFGLPGFDSMGLPRKVLAALILEDIEEPTPVQAAVIPDALAGYDVLGRARTGSGKTLAFGIPLVSRLAGEKSRIHRPRALVIVPTRELAGQVERAMELVARAVRLKLTTVYGGTRYDRQIQELRQGTDIVVATPGRLQDLIDRGVLQTDDVQVTVLDEADHLCDLGFYPAVDKLLAQTPVESQRLLLSATLDGDVDALVRTHLRDPRRHEVDPTGSSITTMDHHVLVVGGFRDKVAAAVALVEANPRSIVFTRTREGATELRDAFAERGVSAVDMHGNLTQRVRERNLARFADGRADVVVATDVAARGIHVDGVGMVIHFDPPTDSKAYLHRSGRTARAGESGAVVTVVTPRQLATVVRLQREAGVRARHHDLRTAPSPMTAAALAESGTDSPEPRKAREHRPGASRSGPRTGAARSGRPSAEGRGRWQDRRTDGPGGDRPQRSGRPDRRRADRARPDRDRPDGSSADRDRPERARSSDRTPSSRRTERSDRPVRASGKKARWTREEREARDKRR